MSNLVFRALLYSRPLNNGYSRGERTKGPIKSRLVMESVLKILAQHWGHIYLSSGKVSFCSLTGATKT